MRKKKKNPLYPLPPDYTDLTEEGKKEARLSILSKQDTPEEMVMAWACFRRWYLEKSPTFYKNRMVSPKFHYIIPRDMGKHRLNILAAPRGSAKSVVAGTEMPMLLAATRPHFEVALCLATDKLVEERISKIMLEFETNDALQADLGPFKPASRTKRWNQHDLNLQQGGRIRGMSTEGRKRGARPDFFILDDPEFDSKNRASSDALIEQFEVLLFKQILPMLGPVGCGIYWIGTCISRHSFLYRAFLGEDERFNLWNRIFLKAADLCDPIEREATDCKFKNSIWPEKWTEEELQTLEMEIGAQHFASEFMNQPGSPQDRILRIDDKKNTYTLHEMGSIPNRPLADPLDNATIAYHLFNKENNEWVVTVNPYQQWVKHLFRIMLVDHAFTVSPTSDFSCIIIVGIDHQDIVWVLDIWLGRVTHDNLDNQIMKMGEQWFPQFVSAESISIQKQLVEKHKDVIESQAHLTGWSPKVVSPNYTTRLKKEQRIASLEWRFNKGRIKFPANSWVVNKPPWRMLLSQIADFTMDLSLLTYDDAVDTLAIVHYIPRLSGMIMEVEPTVKTPLDYLKEGKRTLPGIPGIPISSSLNTSSLSNEDLDKIKKNLQRCQGKRPLRISTRYSGGGPSGFRRRTRWPS